MKDPKRSINARLIKKLIEARGSKGLVEVAYKSGVSVSMLCRIANDSYGGQIPRGGNRFAISRELGVHEDELFPLLSELEKVS